MDVNLSEIVIEYCCFVNKKEHVHKGLGIIDTKLIFFGDNILHFISKTIVKLNFLIPDILMHI